MKDIPKIKSAESIIICGGKNKSVQLFLTDCKTPSEVLAYINLCKMASLPGENIIC